MRHASEFELEVSPPNKQLERTGMRHRERAASAAFHCAHAARWTLGHAAAQLQRYAQICA
jgi:hypothetical protein